MSHLQDGWRDRLCKHWEKGKERIGGYRVGRCLHGKPLLHDGPFDQFEDNCADCNCPHYEPNMKAEADR